MCTHRYPICCKTTALSVLHICITKREIFVCTSRNTTNYCFAFMLPFHTLKITRGIFTVLPFYFIFAKRAKERKGIEIKKKVHGCQIAYIYTRFVFFSLQLSTVCHNASFQCKHKHKQKSVAQKKRPLLAPKSVWFKNDIQQEQTNKRKSQSGKKYLWKWLGIVEIFEHNNWK